MVVEQVHLPINLLFPQIVASSLALTGLHRHLRLPKRQRDEIGTEGRVRKVHVLSCYSSEAYD